jgi:RNA polymerase sigma factor (sigma-70 family)
MRLFLPVSDADFRAALTPPGDERLLTRLYERLRPSVTKYLKKKGAESEDAEDAFDTGIVVLWKRARGRGYELDFKFYPFLLETCKHTWYKMLRDKKNRSQGITEEAFVVLNPDLDAQELLEETEFEEQLLRYLDRLGAPCRELLLLWGEKMPYEEIAQKMSYKNAETARQQKFKCMERLKKMFRDGSKD